MKEVSGKQAIHYRNYRRARDRALAKLSKLYPDVYKELLAEERENDEKEGNLWSIAIDSRLFVTTQSDKNSIPTVAGRTDYEGADEGYDGGEA